MMLLPCKRATRETSTRPSVFEDLALPLLPALYNVAHWLTRNASDAEDLVQETFLKSLRGFAGFEPESNFQAWIFRILRNTYLTSRSGLAARRTVALEDELDERSESGPELYPESAIDMDVAHTGANSLYIEGIRRTDRLCAEIWQMIESNPEYKARTTMLILPDFRS
jgi:RNA polymerase sigma factor (sigma-70 family)